jgi:integrase
VDPGTFEPSTLADRARKAWLEAELRPITLHEARHTYASLMAAAGVPLEDVADYMGHSTVEVTRKLYRHLYPDSRRRAADALEAFLESLPKRLRGSRRGSPLPLKAVSSGSQRSRRDSNRWCQPQTKSRGSR